VFKRHLKTGLIQQTFVEFVELLLFVIGDHVIDCLVNNLCKIVNALSINTAIVIASLNTHHRRHTLHTRPYYLPHYVVRHKTPIYTRLKDLCTVTLIVYSTVRYTVPFLRRTELFSVQQPAVRSISDREITIQKLYAT